MFTLVTDEHRMIHESVRKLFEDLAATDAAARQRDGSRIAPGEVADALADLGLFGTTADDIPMSLAQVQCLVAQEAGAAALPFPVLERLAGHALAMRGATAGALASTGNTTMSAAQATLSELPVFDGSHLHGAARLIPFMDLAQTVFIAARHGDQPVLVEVALASAGIQATARASVEAEYTLHDLQFNGVAGTLMVAPAQQVSATDFLQQRASLLAAAEIAGACRRMVTMTRDYLLVRSQFGQALGANQALKHALADSHVRVEALSAAVDYAAAAQDAGDSDAAEAIHAAKHYAGKSAKAVAECALQLHGAIGYTMEYPLHLLMRRAHRLAASHGSNRAQGEHLFESFRNAVEI